MADDDERPHVLVSDRQDLSVDLEGLTALARETLLGEGEPDVELSISLVTPDEMADLHERYLGEPGPTDVLSFPQEDEPPEPGGLRMLGDVVLCPAVAAERPHPSDEVRLLLVHGVLHLLGYDHESEEERAEMWPRQETYSGVTMDTEGSS